MTMQNVAWPATMVQKPGSGPASLIADSSAMPVMIPGNAMGSTNSSVSVFFAGKAAARERKRRERAENDREQRGDARNTERQPHGCPHIAAREARSNQCNVSPGGGNWYVRSSVVNAYSRMISTGKCMNASPAYAARRDAERHGRMPAPL